MSFKKVERSYFSSPSGWRLATYDEVKNGLKDDKVQSLINKWDRVRLLDGWILGPGYDFQRGKDLQIGNDFRGCLGFMLLIRTQSGKSFISGSAYVDVNLTEFGKEVALFLCVDDWNYEVVYWLLNSWSNSNTMDLADVREETLAFSDAAKFIERSRMMGSLARRLGAEGGTALEKAEKKRYSGIDSVKDVLSGMIKLVTEERDVAQLIGGGIWQFRGYDGHEYCLTKSVEYDGVDAAFWSFVCDSFAGFVVEVAALESLICVRNMKTICPSEKNFNIATSILLYLSDYRSDIIHAPLAHKCRGSCAFKILKYAMDKVAGDGQSFMDILQNNPMWRCYDDPTGNYHLVDKLLVILARGNYIDLEGEEEKVEALVVNRLLECRAQPGEAYAIGKHKYETALHHAATSKNVRHGIQVAESLLRKCESVDATDERGRTALHRASKWGRARICELLLDKGATVGLQDEYGKTALHYVATCNSEDESEDEDKDDDDRMNVAKILLRKCDEKQRGLLANAADKKGRTALHRASKKGHAHMCQLFIDNSATVDAINKDGKTALHYAATSFYEDNGMKVAECLLGKVDGNEREVFTNMKDVKGRTALLRAAETGKARICQLLLRYGATLDVRDDNGQTPLHGAVEERQKEVIDVFMEHPHITESIDVENNSGDSPFDIAVAYNNIEIAAKLLSKSKQSEAHFNKIDPVDLLRCSLVDGYPNIVAKLLEKGTKLPEADDGKIGLHLAVACDEEDKARVLVRIVLQAETQGKQQNMVAKPDKKGRTVLHDAALNGYYSICVHFLRINPSIIYTKSKDGQNPLYDAVKGKYKGVDLLQRLLKEYFKKDKDVDDLLDRRGLTPLHVAVSEGKTELVTELLSNKKIREKYLSRGDIIGQTALHKAAKRGDSKTVTVLLNHGADPLNERDCDGRTALHYAVQSEAEGNKTELADLILKGCKSEEEKLLLLWASAAGLGTVDDNLSDADPLHKFLLGKKNEIRQNLGTGNLLKTAASLGNIEMTKELITRGYQIEDIHDKVWRGRLESENKKNVDTVSKQIENIREQANDQPTVSDNLGRSDYAQGLAALFLNPYLKPPIAVGISGSWGMGKSSLMVQTESLLLTTAAQMALLTSSKLSVSALKLPDISPFVLSKKGKSKYEKIERQINEEIGRRSNYGQKINKNMFTRFLRVFLSEDEHGKKITLPEFLQKYDLKYHNIFKSLAAMDSSYMFTTKAKEDQQPERSRLKSLWDMVKFTTKAKEDQQPERSRLKSLWDMVKFKRNAEQLEGEFSGDGNAEQLEGEFSGRDGNASVAPQEKTNAQHSMADVLGEGNVPAVLTVQYNAWKYRNETEALAGIAVEISREIEGTMTKSQWLNTCWRNTWKKKKYAIFIEIIFPCLLTIALAFSITLIVWIILDKYKLREWAKAKYACLPVAIVITVWTLTKSLMGILKPVSTQLMNFISFPDHSDKLGYQERVISDISFLKDEIGRSPHWLFIVLSWVFTMLAVLWRLITESWVTSLLFNHSRLEISLEVPEVAPASGNNLRIIVFVDDLDRCNESVILQVLSAVNLVLAVCQINVVIGMDKRLIERAIIKKYGDAKANKSSKAGQGLAEMYLQKIIQLPLDLPDPSEEQSRKFLEGQLGVFEEKEIEDKASVPGDNREIEAVQQNTGAPELAIDITEMGNVKKSSSSILIREMLFVRYSQGELDAFCYFQKLATDCRKLPREWKRLLNYHRLVWYIFSLSKEAKVLLGWQVQLITWIFICWEWKENVNFIIENWRNIPALRNSGSNAHVSLLMIVEYFMEENERDKNMKMTTTAEEAEGTGDKTPESSKRENEKSPDATDGIKEITTKPGGVHTKSTDNSENREMVLEGRMDTLEKTLVELKKEMKELKEMVSDELKKEMNELKQQVSDEMKKDISELKKQMVYLKSGKKEKTGEEKKIKLHNVSNWDKMKSALERYDVPMDGIQAFQRFRFYCIAGYLPRHLTTG